jgi:hypothetical protein
MEHPRKKQSAQCLLTHTKPRTSSSSAATPGICEDSLGFYKPPHLSERAVYNFQDEDLLGVGSWSAAYPSIDLYCYDSNLSIELEEIAD